MNERRTVALNGDESDRWSVNTFLTDQLIAIGTMGVTKIPVAGMIEVHEPELGQREAAIWRTIKADGSLATKPEEAVQILWCRPGLKGGDDEAWREKLAVAHREIDKSIERLVAHKIGSEPVCDQQLDGWSWTDADGKVHHKEGGA